MSFHRKIITAALICACTSFTAWCQPDYANLYYKQLTPDQGLSQHNVYSVFTDSRGFVWLTGLDGINRFDGTRCLTNNEIAPGLKDVTVTTSIVEDGKGDIWFGFARGIIRYSYKENRFEPVVLPLVTTNGLQIEKDAYFDIIGISGEGNFIISSFLSPKNGITRQNKVILIYDPGQKSMHGIPVGKKGNNPLTHFFSWLKDSYGKSIAYVAENYADSLFIYKITGSHNAKNLTETVYTRRWENDMHRIVWMQDENTALIFTAGQIERLHLRSGQSQRFPIPKDITFMNFQPRVSKDVHGNLWIGTDLAGYYVLSGKNLEVLAERKYKPNQAGGISGNDINPECDNRGNVWLKVRNRGVDYSNLSDFRFTSYYTDQSNKSKDSSSFIRDIVEKPNGGFYTSPIGYIAEFDERLNFIRTLPGLDFNFSSPDMHLANERLFIGLELGSPVHSLIIYDLKNHSYRKVRNNYMQRTEGSLVYQMSPTRDGHLLTSTYAGLWKFNTRTEQFENIPGVSDSTEGVVFSYEDRLGRIYKGIGHKGLKVYENTRSGYRICFSISENITVKHCSPVNDSMIWLGTTRGLYLFNTLRLKVEKIYTTGQGLANNVVYAIMPDEKDNLWLSTNKGLSYFYVREGRFRNFTRNDGLQSSEFNTHTVVKTRDGRIIFGGVNGLTLVNPAMLQKNTTIPPVQITAIRTDSSYNPFAFDEQNTLRLPPGSNFVDFEITALDFINPSECRIRYRLKGYDEEWRETGNPGVIRYAKLPPGSYEMEYYSSNTEGQWSKEKKLFMFSIGAQWWQTRAFQIGGILFLMTLFALLLHFYIRSRINHQRTRLEQYLAIQKDRERIIGDLHDDVGATLSSMHIYGDLATDVWESQPAKSKEMVGKITRQSKDLMTRMSDIIWSLKSPLEEKNAFGVRLRNYSQDLLAGRGIAAEITVDEELAAHINNPLVRKNLLLIAKEAMNNIAKYSGAGKAEISLKRDGDWLFLRIRDDGCGFDPANHRNGNGLGNLRQRCEQLGGHYSLETSPGKGVIITCRIPIAIISHAG